MRLDLADQVETDADDDEQGRSAEVERHVELLGQDHGHEADRGNVDRADRGDAREHVVDELGRALAGPDAGMNPARLLDVVRDVDRIDHDRRVEEAEEDDQRDVDEVVEEADPGRGSPGRSR